MNEPMRRLFDDVFSRPMLPYLSPIVSERQRELDVEQDKADKLAEALNDEIYFRTLDEDYEVLDYGQIMRALRNLNDAIAGKQYAQDAVFTALGIIQRRLKTVISEEVEA